MSEELEQWSRIFQERYKDQIETKLRRRHKIMAQDAGRIFRNLEVTSGEYHAKVNKLMAGLTYIRSCLCRVLDEDAIWYRNYVKTCIMQLYGVQDYLDKWEEFFNKNRKNQTKILRRVKGDLLKKLSK